MIRVDLMRFDEASVQGFHQLSILFAIFLKQQIKNRTYYPVYMAATILSFNGRKEGYRTLFKF